MPVAAKAGCSMRIVSCVDVMTALMLLSLFLILFFFLGFKEFAPHLSISFTRCFVIYICVGIRRLLDGYLDCVSVPLSLSGLVARKLLK